MSDPTYSIVPDVLQGQAVLRQALRLLDGAAETTIASTAAACVITAWEATQPSVEPGVAITAAHTGRLLLLATWAQELWVFHPGDWTAAFLPGVQGEPAWTGNPQVLGTVPFRNGALEP